MVLEDKGKKSLSFLHSVLLIVETVVLRAAKKQRWRGEGGRWGVATSHKQGRKMVSSGIRKGLENS